jgi:hypothetical protein
MLECQFQALIVIVHRETSFDRANLGAASAIIAKIDIDLISGIA